MRLNLVDFRLKSALRRREILAEFGFDLSYFFLLHKISVPVVERGADLVVKPIVVYAWDESALRLMVIYFLFVLKQFQLFKVVVVQAVKCVTVSRRFAFHLFLRGGSRSTHKARS